MPKKQLVIRWTLLDNMSSHNKESYEVVIGCIRACLQCSYSQKLLSALIKQFQWQRIPRSSWNVVPLDSWIDLVCCYLHCYECSSWFASSSLWAEDCRELQIKQTNDIKLSAENTSRCHYINQWRRYIV